MILRIGARAVLDVRSYREASERYAAERDASGEGYSTFPRGQVWLDAAMIAWVSYNGKVWHPGEVTSVSQPIYDPRAAAC